MTVCHPMRTIFRNHVPHCLYALYTGLTDQIENLCKIDTFKTFQPKFYKPENSFDYIYSVPRRTPISGQCDRALPPNTFPGSLVNTGRITVPPSCMAHSALFVLLGNGILNMGNVKIQATIDYPRVLPLPSIEKLGKFNFSLSNDKYATLNSLFPDKNDSAETTGVALAVLMDEVQRIHFDTAGGLRSSPIQWESWNIMAAIGAIIGAVVMSLLVVRTSALWELLKCGTHLPFAEEDPYMQPIRPSSNNSSYVHACQPGAEPLPRYVAHYKTSDGDTTVLEPVVLQP